MAVWTMSESSGVVYATVEATKPLHDRYHGDINRVEVHTVSGGELRRCTTPVRVYATFEELRRKLGDASYHVRDLYIVDGSDEDRVAVQRGFAS